MNTCSRGYLLGRCVISPVTSNYELLSLLDQLLADRVEAADTADLKAIVMDLDQLFDEGYVSSTPTIAQLACDTVLAFMGKAMSEHASCAWIDAASLLPPEGDLVLLAGPSEAGKTTLSLAMHLAHGWRALAEDITLIELTSRQIIPFARPSSLRPGCAEMIHRATGHRPEPLLLGEWFFAKQMFVHERLPAKFAAAVRLEPATENACEPISLRAVPAADYLRSLLPLSNSLRLTSAVNLLHDAIADARCFVLRGGTLEERMDLLLDIAKKGPAAEEKQ